MAALELRVVMTIGLVIFSLVMAKSSSLGEYEIKLALQTTLWVANTIVKASWMTRKPPRLNLTTNLVPSSLRFLFLEVLLVVVIIRDEVL